MERVMDGFVLLLIGVAIIWIFPAWIVSLKRRIEQLEQSQADARRASEHVTALTRKIAALEDAIKTGTRETAPAPSRPVVAPPIVSSPIVTEPAAAPPAATPIATPKPIVAPVPPPVPAGRPAP